MSRKLSGHDCGKEDEVLLSVIIVNYNGRIFIEACLQSLATYLSCLQHEIVVVDNNSADGSREYIAAAWPAVQLIRSSDNIGFAKGNNLGAASARGRFLLLLNNDTQLLGPLQPLLDYLEAHPDTDVVGGRLRNPDGSIQPSVGYDHSPLRLLVSWCLPRTCTCFGRLKLYERQPEFYQHDHHQVDWVSGAYLCIRRRMWQELSGFDREIFMYVEDADLCYRVRKQGGKVAFVASADICHFEGGGRKGMSGHALMATIDSYRLILAKRHGRMVCDLTCAGLAMIFLVRAGLYFLVGRVRHDPVTGNKAGFYLQGAGRLLRGSRENHAGDSVHLAGGGKR